MQGMAKIMHRVAVLELTVSRSKKNSGTPTSAAAPKQMICRPVSPNSTFRLIFARSLWTIALANESPPEG